MVADEAWRYDRFTTAAMATAQASSTTIDSGRVTACGKGLRNDGIFRYLYRRFGGGE
jgi:hypothetical protein